MLGIFFQNMRMLFPFEYLDWQMFVLPLTSMKVILRSFYVLWRYFDVEFLAQITCSMVSPAICLGVMVMNLSFVGNSRSLVLFLVGFPFGCCYGCNCGKRYGSHLVVFSLYSVLKDGESLSLFLSKWFHSSLYWNFWSVIFSLCNFISSLLWVM